MINNPKRETDEQRARRWLHESGCDDGDPRDVCAVEDSLVEEFRAIRAEAAEQARTYPAHEPLAKLAKRIRRMR